MTFRRFSSYFWFRSLALVVTCTFCPTLHAQALLASASVPDAPVPSVEPVSPVVLSPSIASTEHKFWDKQNSVLFIAAAALNGADFAVTRANLQSGGQELNPVVRVFGRSTAGLAMNFVGETAGVMSLGYFFHKTGHHKLERAISLVDVGGSAGAVAFGLAHR
jgi:hypothetical protein